MALPKVAERKLVSFQAPAWCFLIHMSNKILKWPTKKDFIQKVSSKVLQRRKKDAKNIPKLQHKGFGQELAICKMQLALIKKWIKGIPKKKSKSGSSYS